MAKERREPIRTSDQLSKTATGIQGLDEITGGGLPTGRISLITGGPGSGKTLFGTEFLVRGATQFDEPGVFITFEETAPELRINVVSLGFDLQVLEARKKLAIDFVRIERSEIEETGDYDLEGLFIRIGLLIKQIGARRVVLDSIEALFSGFPNELILRAELRRLFRWLKEAGVTTVVTAEKGETSLTRHGIEEYISDCVIVLDQSIRENVATRRLRIVKYRGSNHGSNQFPFLIGDRGLSVLPITSIDMTAEASTRRISSGLAQLDAMLDGKGFFRGSAVLISGTAGTGKSSLAATMTESACANGETCLYLAFEETSAQIARNMKSIGVDLERWIKAKRLCIHSTRSTACGLESHLVVIHDLVRNLKPAVVVFDPISNLVSIGSTIEVKAMLTRLIDFLKSNQITMLFTHLIRDIEHIEETDLGISSLMDTWLSLRDVESNGERNRVLHIIKSRGMAHSNQLQEFLITSKGIRLLDVYNGRGKVLTGSARAIQEAADAAEETRRSEEIESERLINERNRLAIEAQIASLQAELEGLSNKSKRIAAHERMREQSSAAQRQRLSELRHTDTAAPSANSRKKTTRR